MSLDTLMVIHLIFLIMYLIQYIIQWKTRGLDFLPFNHGLTLFFLVRLKCLSATPFQHILKELIIPFLFPHTTAIIIMASKLESIAKAFLIPSFSVQRGKIAESKAKCSISWGIHSIFQVSFFPIMQHAMIYQ